MKTLNKFLLSALTFILGVCRLNAQNNQVDADPKSIFSASVNYVSKLNYFGRVDSLKSSGMLTSIGYQHKSGLYAQSNFIFIQNAAQPLNYTGASLEGGYKFPQSKHFSGNLFFTDFLYKDNSVLVQSALHYQTGINLVVNNNIANINTGADLKFSNDKTDLGISFGVDHIFLIKTANKKIVWAINPSAYTYWGTQNFSYSYLQKTSFLGIPTGSAPASASYTRFNLLSYEFSAPVVLVAGKLNASFTPSFVVPENLIANERGMQLFYCTIGIGIRL